MALKPVDHPVIGTLLPDQWGSHLQCFREIPGLRHFVPSYAARSVQSLSAADRQLVDSWRTPTAALIKKCRDFAIFDGLRGLGVFEVTFVPAEDGGLSAEQVAAYQFFFDHQPEIGKNLSDMLLRYYQIARSDDEEWFDDSDCPEVDLVDELAPLVTLDGVNFTSHHCEGMALVSLSWNPEWEQEHGLSLLIWRDQVVACDLEQVSEILDSSLMDSLIWNRQHMTAAERQALDRVAAHLELGPEDE